MSIEWLDTTGKNTSKEDVSISVRKNGNGGQRTCITFRNQSWLKITHDDHVIVGIDEGEKRICFKDGVTSGYKLVKAGSDSSRYIGIRRVLKDYEGDYKLCMSADGKFFYVKKGEG